MSRIEIFPFSKFLWKSKEVESSWEPMRQRIYSSVHYAEYEMVKRGYRKCDVYDFNPQNILDRLRKVAIDGLIFMPILVSKQYGGYGHRHYVTSKFEDGTFIYGAVARDKEDAIRFHDAGVTSTSKRIRGWSDMNPSGIDHNVTGELLGYPKCDREFFDKTWLQGGCLDPMYEMAENTVDHEVVSEGHIKVSGNPMLNRLARYWGFNIIPFFPHSYDCKYAADFAERFFGLMREYDGDATEACLEFLSMPMRWSMLNAITMLEHPLFWGCANGYYRSGKVTVDWFPQA